MVDYMNLCYIRSHIHSLSFRGNLPRCIYSIFLPPLSYLHFHGVCGNSKTTGTVRFT